MNNATNGGQTVASVTIVKILAPVKIFRRCFRDARFHNAGANNWWICILEYYGWLLLFLILMFMVRILIASKLVYKQLREWQISF